MLWDGLKEDLCVTKYVLQKKNNNHKLFKIIKNNKYRIINSINMNVLTSVDFAKKSWICDVLFDP